MNTFAAGRRDIDVDVDPDYHPVATAAAVVATAIGVGSVVNTLPPAPHGRTRLARPNS